MLAQAEKTCLIKVEDMLKAESFAKTFALLKKKKAVWIVHQHFVSVQPIVLNLTLHETETVYKKQNCKLVQILDKTRNKKLVFEKL